jgi:hypothetical protein
MEDVLDGEGIRAKATDEAGDTVVYVSETRRELNLPRRDQDSLLEESAASAVGVDGSISRAERTRVDAEDDHVRRRV